MVIRAGAMAKQILTVLEAHAGRAQATAERVLEVMDTNLRQPGTQPGPFPCGGQHAIQGLALHS